MIKFLGKQDGEIVIGIGISEGNVQLLKKDMPILIDLKDMGLPSGYISIIYGATDEQLVKIMVDLGLVTDDVEIRNQSKLHEG